MPLRVYDNNAWQSPTSIRIYNDSEWKTASVGYVYDMGMWRVVFPDPIIPVVNVIDNGSWAQVNTVDVFYVQMILNTSELESMVGELYSGTSATGTPLQTQTFNYEYILEGYEYYIRFYVSSPGTYTIKATATSITQNSVSVVSQPISPILLSVNITSASLTRDLYSVSWNSVGQEEYFVGVAQVGGPITILQQGSSTTLRSASGGISPRLLGNTQYDLYVGIRRSGEFMYTQTSIRLTTPAGSTPAITNFSATSTCNSIFATWTNNSDVDNGVISISQAVAFEQGMPIFGTPQNFNFVAPQNSRTFLNLTPLGHLNSPTAGIYQLSIYGRSIDNTETEIQYLNINTLPASVTTPTNFTATSNFYGNGATLSWSASTGNCSSVTGYNVQYKLSSSGTWLTLVNGITATSADTTLYVTLTANTSYDFRVRANGSNGIVSEYATTTITTNNNPHNIFLYTLPLSTTTFTAVSVIAQLRNISNQNVTNSGIAVNFSASPSGRGTFSSTSATTGTNGQATVTFTPNATTGDITLSATSSGLVSGSWNLGVALSPGLTPSLSTARTNFGYDVTHSNYNSLYSYSGTVTNGGFNFDSVWNDGFYTIVIPPINTAFPVASRNALVSVTCTSGTWTAQPSATTTVTSSRTGYADASASVSNTPTGTLSFSYTWYFGNGGLAGSGQTLAITPAMRGRNMYCIVIATRTGGTQGFQAQSNTLAIPA